MRIKEHILLQCQSFNYKRFTLTNNTVPHTLSFPTLSSQKSSSFFFLSHNSLTSNQDLYPITSKGLVNFLVYNFDPYFEVQGNNTRILLLFHLIICMQKVAIYRQHRLWLRGCMAILFLSNNCFPICILHHMLRVIRDPINNPAVINVHIHISLKLPLLAGPFVTEINGNSYP